MTWPLFNPPQDNTAWTWREHIFTDDELNRIVAQGEEQGLLDATVGPGAVNSYRSSTLCFFDTAERGVSASHNSKNRVLDFS